MNKKLKTYPEQRVPQFIYSPHWRDELPQDDL